MSVLAISPTNSISTPSISTLQERAYEAFSGSDFVKNSTSIHLKVLYGLVHSPGVNLVLAEKVFDAASEDFKTHTSTEKSGASSNFPSVADSDELINISYGGGRRFLQAFLKESHTGYASEAGGQGMFVTTDSTMCRDIQYALRTPLANFDDPVVMVAKIATRHLQQVNPNSYEAVLPQRSVRHLQNLGTIDHELKSIDGWRAAVADLLPLIPMRYFRKGVAQYLIEELEKTNKYSSDDIQDIVFYLAPFYS